MIQVQHSTLSLCRIEYQLPNLIVAAITKESLYNAFKNGITAEQASFAACSRGSYSQSQSYEVRISLSYVQIANGMQQTSYSLCFISLRYLALHSCQWRNTWRILPSSNLYSVQVACKNIGAWHKGIISIKQGSSAKPIVIAQSPRDFNQHSLLIHRKQYFYFSCVHQSKYSINLMQTRIILLSSKY